MHEKAQRAAVVLCPGVGFDVVPTDCVAAKLKQALPDATHLALGFDGRAGLSKGTAKTAIESVGDGSCVRLDGKIVAVELGSHTRRIDFGAGEKLAVGIPWGDVSTAYYTTGIRQHRSVHGVVAENPSTACGARTGSRPLLRRRWIRRW